MKSLLIISMERENANRTRGDSCKEHPDRESSEGQTGKIFQSLHHSSVRGHRISTVGLKRMAIVLLHGCMACSGFFMNLLTYQTGWSRLACLEGGQFVRSTLGCSSAKPARSLLQCHLRDPVRLLIRQIEEFLRGIKGAIRIPSLSFQYLRRPGCTAKLLCFLITGEFAAPSPLSLMLLNGENLRT